MHFARDLRFAFRLLARTPALTALVVGIMAVAVGASSTVMSVVDAVLLQPLPYPDPERLVAVWEVDPAHPEIWRQTSAGNAVDWRRESRSLESVAVARNASFSLTAFDPPETPLVRLITANYFPTLGVEPVLGRTFSADEDRPGGPAVMLLSWGLWQRRFGGDPRIVGRVTELDGAPYTVVGVMPPGTDNPSFGTPESPQAWLPLGLPESGASQLGAGHLVLGRLAEGVNLNEAREELAAISSRLREAYPDTNARVSAWVTPLAERLVGGARPALLVALGAVGLVLLVACANVASLLLVRAAGRRQEMAIRRALGADAGALTRQLAVEGVVLNLAAGAGGLLLARVGMIWISSLVPRGFNIPDLHHLGLTPRVALFTLAVTLLSGLLFGVAPAFQTLGSQPETVLRETGGRSSGGRRSHRLRRGLVIAEVTLSAMLLVGAGLMLQSFSRLQRLDPGFAPDHLLTFRLGMRGERLDDPHRRQLFLPAVRQRIAEIPGVRSVGISEALPFFAGFIELPVLPAGTSPPAVGTEPRVLVRRSLPGFLEALGVPLLAGRALEDRDGADSAPVAVVNRALARLLWGREDVLGEGLELLDGRDLTRRVVGVVGDVRSDALPPEPQPVVYLPMAQETVPANVHFAIRSRGEPLSLLPAVQSAVASVDRLTKLYLIRSMEQLLARIDWRARLLSSLLAVFGAIALALAVTGVYGVVASTVAQRRREIGIRTALGATPRQVTGLVLRSGLSLTAAGILAGVMGAVLLARVLESQLFGVGVTDPVTFLVVVLLLLAASLTASAAPVRQALGVDPAVVLREE